LRFVARTASLGAALAVLPLATAAAQIIQPNQAKATDLFTVGASFMGGLPVGEFRREDNGGFGGEVVLGFQPFRGQPLLIRGSAGGMKYGSRKAWGYQETCDDNGCWLEEQEYDARSHSMYNLQIGPEVFLTSGTIRPFAFATLGRTFFSSRANFKPTTPYGEEWSQGIFSSNNFSTTYGGGLRWMATTSGRQIGFELSARVHRNIGAEYLTEPRVTENPDGSLVIDPAYGAAHVLGIQLGIWFGPHVRWNQR
jgi:hypothetical protein